MEIQKSPAVAMTADPSASARISDKRKRIVSSIAALLLVQTIRGRGLLAELENEAEAAAETALRLDQQQMPAIGKGEGQIALSKQIAQIGVGLHAPWQ